MKYFFEINFKFAHCFDVHNVKQIKIQILLQTCVSYSELPFDISTMIYADTPTARTVAPRNISLHGIYIRHGNSEISALLRINLYRLICLRHLTRSRAIQNRIFFLRKKPIFLHERKTCSELPSNLSTMIFSIHF